MSGNGERNIGLARALSKLGFCSRSKAVELIRDRRVRLEGVVRQDPETPVRLGRDLIEVDGSAIEAAPKIHLMLNKPRGVVTTASDERGRGTVYDCLRSANREEMKWVATVGRLDKASEGLLLLTNDSEWAAQVLAPETHVEKIYHVQIGGVADDALLDSLRKGVRNGGDFLEVKRASILRCGERNSWLEVVLDEGRNRHIRRMLKTLEIEVLRLVRVAIGPLQLGDLAKGTYRSLTSGEIQAIEQAMRRSSRTSKRTAR